MLAEEALSTHQRRQELAVFSLMNEVEVSNGGVTKSNSNIPIVPIPVHGSTTVSPPAPAPASTFSFRFPVAASPPLSVYSDSRPASQHVVASCFSSHTTYDSTYDSSVCDHPTASLWMSSDSVSPETSCYSRHSSPSLPSSSMTTQSYMPFPNIKKQTATTATTSVSSSAKSLDSDVQGNFLMFRIVH
jgi:hypothetical protein